MRKHIKCINESYYSRQREDYQLCSVIHLHGCKHLNLPLLGDLFAHMLADFSLQRTNVLNELRTLFMEYLIHLPQVGTDRVVIQESVRESTGF